MFDQLVESEPQGADFKNRRRYFMVSSVVVGILFTTAVVISIFAADYGLGNGTFELVEMIAPVAPDAAEPEMQPQRQNAPIVSSANMVATRRDDIARIDETITSIPDKVSTTPSTQMARPNVGQYTIGKYDSNPGNPGTNGREQTNGATVGGLTESIAKNDKPEPEETTPPPPEVKKPSIPKNPISKGVLNGKATDLPKPNYSAAAKSVGAQGQVNVQVVIDESGRVISANAVTGHVLLRADAERAARNARFSPTFLSDVPVKVTGVITYNFVR